MKKQKGQSLVEFALVFPFFLLLIFAIIYSGMLFYDYSTLSSIARSAARERAISSPTGVTDADIKSYYFNSSTKQFRPNLGTGLYKPASNPLDITTSGDDIVVTINMVLGERSPIMEIVVPDRYSIVYHMRKDYKAEN